MQEETQIVASAFSHIGKVRRHNEDSYFIDAEDRLFIVCDGMGGHAAGDVASSLAVRTVRDKWRHVDFERAIRQFGAEDTVATRREVFAKLRAGVLAAHDAIMAEAERDSKKAGMGTTCVACAVAGPDALIAHAGDSRAYLVRRGQAMQITEDQTVIARLAAVGVDVSKADNVWQWRGVLTNALGVSNAYCSTVVVALEPGDRMVLCSDGIAEYFDPSELAAAVTEPPSPGRAAQRLIDTALARGGADNATAIVMKVLDVAPRAKVVRPSIEQIDALSEAPFWAGLTQQMRYRVVRGAWLHTFAPGAPIVPAVHGEQVAWYLLAGSLVGPGGVLQAPCMVYPEALLIGAAAPTDKRWRVQAAATLLAIYQQDFDALCAEEGDGAEPLHAMLADQIR